MRTLMMTMVKKKMVVTSMLFSRGQGTKGIFLQFRDPTHTTCPSPRGLIYLDHRKKNTNLLETFWDTYWVRWLYFSGGRRKIYSVQLLVTLLRPNIEEEALEWDSYQLGLWLWQEPDGCPGLSLLHQHPGRWVRINDSQNASSSKVPLAPWVTLSDKLLEQFSRRLVLVTSTKSCQPQLSWLLCFMVKFHTSHYF